MNSNKLTTCTGPRKHAAGPEDFWGRLSHPIVAKYISELSTWIPPESDFVKDFLVNHIIAQHEEFLRKLVATTSSLSEEYELNPETLRPFFRMLEVVLDPLEFLRLGYLGEDHCNAATAYSRMMDVYIRLREREVIADKSEHRLAIMSFGSKDPAPCYLETKAAFMLQFLNLKGFQNETKRKEMCMDREILFHLGEVLVQLYKVNQLPSVHLPHQARVDVATLSWTLARLSSMEVCTPDTEHRGVLTMVAMPNARELLSNLVERWETQRDQEKETHHLPPNESGESLPWYLQIPLVRWLFLIDGYFGRFLRRLLAEYVGTLSAHAIILVLVSLWRLTRWTAPAEAPTLASFVSSFPAVFFKVFRDIFCQTLVIFILRSCFLVWDYVREV